MQALPAGQESDFILVSCAGTPVPDIDPLDQEKLITFKRRGEAALRTSGLGYTIIRPGPIIEEPGGYRALVFDQVTALCLAFFLSSPIQDPMIRLNIDMLSRPWLKDRYLQGDRIRQSISRADVADVCLKSLHEFSARNKTFEVCHEYAPASGLETYELVAHLPNKANSYLTPALANLERET